MACSCPNKIQIVGSAFVGDSIFNPFTELELYEVSKLGDWDCVNTNDGVNYNISTNIEVGNGVDMTCLIITGKNIVFDAGKDFIPNPPCYIKVGSVWTQAEKDLLFEKIAEVKGNQEIRNGTVSTVVSQYLEFNTNLSEATSNYWTRGALKFTSGNNEGVIRKIQLYQGNNGYIKLRTPLVNIIQSGDTFIIIPIRAFRINHEDVEQIVDDTDTELSSNHGADSWTTGSGLSESGLHDGLDSYSNKGDYKATGFSVSDEYGATLSGIQVETDKINRILWKAN